MDEFNTRYTRTPHAEKLKWIDGMVRIMDNQFRFPGTNWRFGLDPLLGLVPSVGDIASFAVSAMLIMTMARHGASGKLVALMLRRHYEQGKYQGSGKGIVLGVLIAVLVLAVLMIWFMWQIMAWLFQLVAGKS